jgi:molecular chaperone GrpE
MAPERRSGATQEEKPEPIVAPGEPEAPVGPTGPAEEPEPERPEEPAESPAAEPQDEPSRPHGDKLDDAAADHPVVRDLEELTARAEKADEYLELAQRTKADFENYRKRAAREAAAAQERGITKLAKELLPAVDNLDRALQAAQSDENGTATLVSGIKLVHDDVIAALARAGIQGFSPEGERFDPQLHEAVAQIPAEGAESGTVVEVYQRGYRLGEVVIRPARVVVAA